MPYQHTRSLRMVLLDTIHGFYLQALARLPSGELRSRLHRSLLRAGYCYGPMDDPASNIILNTIWYEANFPAEVTPVLDLIGPKSLTRLVSRSFYGLVSFLQTRYHNLSEHQAVQCLVGQLRAADPNFCAPGDEKVQQHIRCSDIPIITEVEQRIPSATIQDAYEAAATAACTTGKRAFAVGKTSGTRQRLGLPCARKGSRQRSGTRQTHILPCASRHSPRQITGTRQKLSSLCVFLHTAKIFQKKINLASTHFPV
jgi:hypothetical protein